jgi:hypothetical protein
MTGPPRPGRLPRGLSKQVRIKLSNFDMTRIYEVASIARTIASAIRRQFFVSVST